VLAQHPKDVRHFPIFRLMIKTRGFWLFQCFVIKIVFALLDHSVLLIPTYIIRILLGSFGCRRLIN
jgi:hypothetical protein